MAADMRGTISDIALDFNTGKTSVTLSLEHAPVQELFSMKEIPELSISIKKYHKKRSLDANAYCWVLCSKIAEKINSSKDEVYEQMLQDYGFLYEGENGYPMAVIGSDADISQFGGHWKFLSDTGTFKTYLMIKGSSEYDTAEMSRFIDCIVLEAKALGIQTETPDEIERLKSLWKGGKNVQKT